MATPNNAPSERTRVRRLPERASYDFAQIAAILDAAWMGHLAFTCEGSVHSIPTAIWREGEHVYFHGAKASRMLKALETSECCMSVGLIDGLVLARSAFHHSMNFRSVVIYGRCEKVEEREAKLRSLEAFMEKLAPGRWAELRPTDDKELNATTVLRLALNEASVKQRSGGPKDDAEDMAAPVWAGVMPLAMHLGEPRTEADSVVSQPPTYTRPGAR